MPLARNIGASGESPRVGLCPKWVGCNGLLRRAAYPERGPGWSVAVDATGVVHGRAMGGGIRWRTGLGWRLRQWVRSWWTGDPCWHVALGHRRRVGGRGLPRQRRLCLATPCCLVRTRRPTRTGHIAIGWLGALGIRRCLRRGCARAVQILEHQRNQHTSDRKPGDQHRHETSSRFCFSFLCAHGADDSAFLTARRRQKPAAAVSLSREPSRTDEFKPVARSAATRFQNL